VIGPGVVVNPKTLLAEMAMLNERGISTDKLRVSTAAHAILPYHVALDAAREAAAAEGAIGTTKRGIGPAYSDRAARAGIRLGDLLDQRRLRDRLTAALPEKNAVLEHVYGAPTFSVESLVDQLSGWGKALRAHLADTSRLVQEALGAGDHILLEGAQGTLLDIDHGTYPYVTSSSPVAGGAATGGGVGPLQIDNVIGVLKAYSTRVGAGPLPTELDDGVGEHLVTVGREFGTTTGRRRRCGWLDLVPLRHAARINSTSSLMLNKLDILTGLPELKVCVAYRIGAETTDEWPLDAEALQRAQPVYRTFPGWTEDLRSAATTDALPKAARRYMAAIEESAGVPITIVSVGPERTQTLVRRGASAAPVHRAA
jgi:adenylosuccinate synthase